MSSDDAKVGGNARGNRLRFELLLLLATGAVVAAELVFVFVPDRAQQPLPQLSEIQRIDAQVYDRKSGNDVAFEVPRSHWEAIHSAMLPAHKDKHAAKWVGLGHLDLNLKDGHSFYVALFLVSVGDTEDLGAFAAGPSSQSRVYYRGGNSSALEKAVAEAFEASKGMK